MLNYFDLGKECVLRGVIEMLCLKMERFLPRLQARAVLQTNNDGILLIAHHLELSNLIYAAEALL